MVPARGTCGALAHTTWSRPALTITAGLMAMRTSSLTAPHGPEGSSLVRVSVTPPAAISSAVGAYVALSAEELGENVPAPPLHVPPVVDPPTTPARCTGKELV